MINPKLGDEGRRVIYARKDPYRDTQVGVISSWNDHYVFVRYGLGSTAAATLREDLEWEIALPTGNKVSEEKST